MGKLVITVHKLFTAAFPAMSGAGQLFLTLVQTFVAIKRGVFFLKPKELPGGNLNLSKASCTLS